MPYHQASNGLAERAIQTLKCAMKKLTKGSLEDRVMKFLFKYCITPQSTTGHSPSDLLFSRRLRSNLDLLRPDLQSKVHQKQNSKKQTHDSHTKEHTSSLVLAKNYRQASPWPPGAIFNKRSSTLFLVQLADDSELRCHPDQLQHRSPNSPDVSETCGGNADNILTWPNISTSEESALILPLAVKGLYLDILMVLGILPIDTYLTLNIVL